MPKNNRPFIITFENNKSSIKSFEDNTTLFEHAKNLAHKDELWPLDGDFHSLETVEELLNREAPMDVTGKPKIFAVYENLDAYVSDMCTFAGVKQTAKELKILLDWGFDLANFFNADEIQEFSKEPDAEEADVDFLRKVCIL